MIIWFWSHLLAKWGCQKWLQKILFVSIQLCHHFDWQALSIDVSIILFVASDHVLPKKAITISSLTIPITISMQKEISGKSCNFFSNSINNYVCHKRHENQMSTSLHAVVNVVSGNVYFVIVIFNICGPKMWSSANSQNSISEKSIFGQFEVIFLNVSIFSRAKVVFSC